MQCAYHPDREPIGACVACGKLICMECKAMLGGKIYCTPCADKLFVKGNDPQLYQPVSPDIIAIDGQSELTTKPRSKKKSRSRKRWAITIFIIIIVILIVLAVIAFISTQYSIDISI